MAKLNLFVVSKICLPFAMAGCAAFMPAAAFADEFTVSSAIDQVTVFQRGAEVTRSGRVSFPAGEHRLIVQNLPQGIDPSRLRLSFGSPDVRLGTLQLEQVHEGDLVNEEERTLQAELDQLLFERQEISDRIEAAGTQLQLLSSLADGSVGGQQTSLAVDDISALLQTLSSASIQAREVIREANREIADKDKEIEQKRFELSQVATRERSQQLLSVYVDTDVSVDTSIDITYAVRQASWTWLYEARLDTEARSLELERNVSVSQRTGEDWSDVAVTITTARPSDETDTPDFDSLYVDFFRPQNIRSERELARRSADFGISNPDTVEEVVVTGSYIRSFANVVASQYLVSFAIPGRISVAPDNQPQILPIDRRAIDVDLVHRTVPELDLNAYLEARFVLESSEPIQAGEVQLYRDGAYIGRRRVATFLPEDEVSFAFGRDERIRVESFPELEESRDGGTFRRSAVEEERVRYRIVSFHPQTIPLEIIGRLPVSRNEAIEVDIPDGATPYDEEEVDGFPGVVMWKRNVMPGEPLEIRHYFRVRFPQDERLDFEGR